jgi:glycosyltransferase involved in cell wall biosynthesis
VGVEPVDRLDLIIRSGGAFDRVLYVIGSTAASVGTLDALRAGSGWVLLHDVHLAELYHHVHRMAPELLVEGSVGATIKTIYPQRYRESVEKMEVVPPDVAERFGILLTADVVAKAAEVIVHSSFEATLVELDTGITPVAIGSQPCPEVIDADRDEPAGPPLVSSFGACLPPPELESLLAAMAIVRREVAGTRLRFVGALDQSQRTQLIELARRVGVAGAVELLDPVDDEAREAARLETAVAVQLQRPGTESMAEVAELLASGVPTVVTDLGPLAELPAEAVVKIEPTSDAAELARAMAGLLRDRGSRDTHAQAAKDHAKASSFTQAAEILAELLFP